MACTNYRGIDSRIDWFLSHNPSGSGMCAQHSWHSLGGNNGCPPAWGCADANEVYDKVKKSGRYWTGTPKRGALVLWKYGNHGHAAICYDEAGTKIATTDPSNGKMVGVEPMSYPNKWGASSSARIYTDQYNGVRFPIGDGADSGDSGGGSSDSFYVTKHIYTNKLGYGEPTNGDESSDTVKELQERLNRISLEGGEELPITGGYYDMTDEEVRLWQEQICGDPPDPPKQSYLGPNQVKKMFPSSIYTIHDEGLPAIADGGGDAESGGEPGDDGTTLGQWLISKGFAVNDSNVPYGRDSEWHEVEFLVVHHTVSADDGDEKDIADYIKNGGEGTYPPLAQIMLGQSGTAWMTCKQREGQAEPGRASQAGSGNGYGVPDDTMNAYSLGIECQCDGKEALNTHPTLYTALIELLSLLCYRYHVPYENIIGHKEWSSTGKVDPLDDMDQIRADVKAFDEGGTVPPPTPDDEIEPGDVYVSKLKYGQTESDSVKRLQQTLNHTTLGSTQPDVDSQGFEVVLAVNGNYDDLTNEVVQTWQAAEGYPVTTFVTVEQANELFAGTGNTVIDDVTVPPEPTPPPEDVITLTGGHCHNIQAAMDEAAFAGKDLRLTGTFYTYVTLYIPDGLHIDATGAKFFVNSESAREKAVFNSGRIRNANNGNAAGYGQAGDFVWTGGTFDGNGDGIFTISHSPAFTITGAVMYNYCSEGNTGHAVEINSSGGEDNKTGIFTVQVKKNSFLGTNRGQRSNSNDEPVHWDWNWDGSGGADPVWSPGDPVNESTQVMCHNLLIEGNTFHRVSESGGWEFALCAIGGHDASDEVYDPEYRHNHVLVRANSIHGAKGSTGVSPNKGAIHLSWTRDAVVEGNKLYGGVERRYITAEDSKDATYCTATGNTSSSPTLSNPNSIIVEG